MCRLVQATLQTAEYNSADTMKTEIAIQLFQNMFLLLFLLFAWGDLSSLCQDFLEVESSLYSHKELPRSVQQNLKFFQ